MVKWKTWRMDPSLAGWFGDAKRKLITEMMSADELKRTISGRMQEHITSVFSVAGSRLHRGGKGGHCHAGVLQWIHA